ncbi:MAG: zinc ribbon domain-containing protein [Anaerolineae bacterium]
MFGNAGTLFTVGVVYAGMVVAAFWLAMIIWTYRDMRARSRDGMAQILVSLMVAVLTLPGLLIYLFLRPRETLSEAYERSLEEEALLQEIEEKPTCPGCGQRVQDHWQVCPHCHTRLKKPCATCGTLLELSWTLCPRCATPQGNYTEAVPNVSYRQQITVKRQDSATLRAAESLEFVDGDDY